MALKEMITDELVGHLVTTDKEILTRMFKNIGATSSSMFDQESELVLEVGDSCNIVGYYGFATAFSFDEMGNLVSIGIYE